MGFLDDLATTRDGRLLRYRHTGWATGSATAWKGPAAVGNNLRHAARMFALLPSTLPAVVR